MSDEAKPGHVCKAGESYEWHKDDLWKNDPWPKSQARLDAWKVYMAKEALKDARAGKLTDKEGLLAIALIMGTQNPSKADIAWANSIIDERKKQK